MHAQLQDRGPKVYIYIYAICIYICTRIYEAGTHPGYIYIYTYTHIHIYVRASARPGSPQPYTYIYILIYYPAGVDWTLGDTECHGASFTLAWVGLYIHAMA